jgi:hypothetical protein
LRKKFKKKEEAVHSNESSCFSLAPSTSNTDLWIVSLFLRFCRKAPPRLSRIWKKPCSIACSAEHKPNVFPPLNQALDDAELITRSAGYPRIYPVWVFYFFHIFFPSTRKVLFLFQYEQYNYFIFCQAFHSY